EGISKIYDETPVRQGRLFTHYGESLVTVAGNMYAGAKDSTFVGAYLDDGLVGFIQINWDENAAILSQILSMQKHWDKAVNNALLAKAVEVCASRRQRYLRYGRIGNHPSLDRFKESNGFAKCEITNYYIPLTWKGRLAVRLGWDRELKDLLPESLKNKLIPGMNWVNRVRAQRRFGSEKESPTDNQQAETDFTGRTADEGKS
ncbi:MAG TPA: hypothetical protein VEF91_00990, partial [Verrucomicrobiae bacterium]|nr:hypothetical protein [Verrucomicrobiae bacterium]